MRDPPSLRIASHAAFSARTPPLRFCDVVVWGAASLKPDTTAAERRRLSPSREKPSAGNQSPLHLEKKEQKQKQEEEASYSELEKLKRELAAEKQKRAELEAELERNRTRENSRLKQNEEQEEQAGEKAKQERGQQNQQVLPPGLPPGFVPATGFVPTVSSPMALPSQPLPTLQVSTLLSTTGAVRDLPAASMAAGAAALISAVSEVDK